MGNCLHGGSSSTGAEVRALARDVTGLSSDVTALGGECTALWEVFDDGRDGLGVSQRAAALALLEHVGELRRRVTGLEDRVDELRNAL